MRSKALLILLIIAIVAAMMLEFRGPGIGQAGASPINPEFEGTSTLVSYMASKGHDVKVIILWSNVPRAVVGCGIVLIVSPEKPYTSKDISEIGNLVRAGYKLIIADEGTYSNAVLESLGIPLRIEGNILKRDNSPLVKAKINLSLFTGHLTMAYASSLNITGRSDPFAFMNDYVVGAKYAGNDVTAYVLGDGSIFTNAALSPPTPLNPYIMFLEAIITDACGQNPVYLLVDASKYEQRPLSVGEMIMAGYSDTEALAGLINPGRLGVAISDTVLSNAVMGLFWAAFIAAIMTSLLMRVFTSGSRQQIFLVPQRTYGIGHARREDVVDIICAHTELGKLLGEACKSNGKPRYEVVTRKLNTLLKREPSLLYKVLEALSK